MNIQSLGILIKSQREALGITQAKLASLTQTSRTTINELETGKIKELGASKVFMVMEILGLSLNINGQQQADDKKILKQMTNSANVSYKNTLTPSAFSKALLTGRIPTGFEGNLLYFFDEAPYSEVNRAIFAVAQQKKVPPKTIRRIAKRMAQEMKSPREIWYD